MTDLSLNQIARALGGEVSSGQVIAPGPEHSPRDRSMAVKLGANGKLLVSSFCGDDPMKCLAYVEGKLGIVWKPERGGAPSQTAAIYRMQDRVTQNNAPQPRAEGSGGIATAMKDPDAALDQVGSTRTSIGARAFRMDLEAERLAEVDDMRESTRSGIEDVNPATAIAELQKTLTILQATQASFSKLTSLSLSDYLR